MLHSRFHKTRARAALLLTIALSCTAVFLFSCAMINKHFDTWSLETDNNTVYLTIQHESDPTELPNTPETLQKFLTLYQQLSQSDDYTYYELYSQPITPTSGQFFDIQTEELADTPEQADAAQISATVPQDFALSVSDGRLFQAKDFTLRKHSSIPVLLGAEYSSLYSLGDTFRADYLYHTYSFQVVGFLEKDSTIETSNGTTLLDHSIVMPSFVYDGTPQSDSLYTSLKIHYANKVSGRLRMAPEQYDTVYSQVTPLLRDTPVGSFSWYSSILGNQPILWGMSLTTLSIVSALVGVLALLATLVLLPHIARNTAATRKSRSFFAVLCLNICGFILSAAVFHLILTGQMQTDVVVPPQYPLLLCGGYCLVFAFLLWRKRTPPKAF